MSDDNVRRPEVRSFGAQDREAVIDLWGRCDLARLWNDTGLDIDRKLARDPDGFLVAVRDGEIIGSVMVGYDGHRGWINYLAVGPEAQRAGVGRTLMRAAEQRLAALGCPKVNLQIRTSNLGAVRFYESIGYSADDVVSMGRRLVDDG